MKRLIIYCIVIIAFIITGCSGANVIAIRSLEKDTEIYKGREVSYKSDENVVTECEVDAIQNEKAYFYIYLKNKKQADLEVNPADIYLKTYFSTADLNEGNGIKHYALDPEKALDQIKEDIEKTKNWKEAAVGINCCLSIFSFIVHVSDDKEYKAGEIAEDAADFAVRQGAIESEYEGKMRELHSDNEFWKDEILRRTVLKEKEEIAGIVVIPVPEKVRFIRVYITAGNTIHEYLYEVKKVKRK